MSAPTKNPRELIPLANISSPSCAGWNCLEKQKLENTKQDYNEKELNIVNQIKDLLEERIKPAVAQDGGDISFVRFEDGIVFLELRGACSGCPSSTITLKSGIENMLKYYIPEVISVEAINQS